MALLRQTYSAIVSINPYKADVPFAAFWIVRSRGFESDKILNHFTVNKEIMKIIIFS